MVLTRSLVSYRLDSGVAVVTLCDPERGNALGTALLEALGAALDHAHTDRARAVLIRASGAEFCRGLDLDEAFGHRRAGPHAGGRLDPVDVEQRVARYAHLLESFRACPCPVVALVEGSARGGGVGLVGAADVVLATHDASFQLTEVFFNLLPGVAAAHLTPGRLAPGVLRSLSLTGTPVGAEQAHRWGLVDRILPEGGAERGVRTVLRSLLRGSPEAVRSLKAFWSDRIDPGVAANGRAGARETARLVADPRTARGVDDLRDGRLPSWSRSFRPELPLTSEGDPGPEPPGDGPPEAPVVVANSEPGLMEIRLNDRSGRNALSEAVVTRLLEAFDEIAQRDDIRVCLLAGLPDVFCSGASAETLEGVARGDIHLGEAELARALLECPVPVVVAAEGHAVGGGLVVLAAADVAVLSNEARYGAVFMELGLTPGMGCTSLLPELVGPFLAREMMFTGGTYRGAELARLGAPLPRVVAAHQVEGTARSVARRIAEKGAEAVRLLKRTMAAPRLAALTAARRREDEMHATLLSDPSAAAAIVERFPS